MKKHIFGTLIVLIVSLAFALKVEAKEYYVSNTGSDTAVGTISAPFKTISYGISKLVAGDTLYVRAGNYPGFSAKKSGTATMPITIAGYNNEYPKITGGNPVKTYQLSYIVIKGFDISGATTASGIRIDQGGNITIQNNRVHDNYGSGVNGIMILNSPNNKIINNTVYSNTTSGIRTYGSPSTGNEVAYNTVYNHTLSAGNSDGINCQGANKLSIHHNTVYGNSDDGIDVWSCTYNTVSYNTVSKNGGTGDGNGIKLGGSPTGGFNTVIGNVSYSNVTSGFTSNGSGGNKYFNNVAYNNGKDGYSDSWRTTNITSKSTFINNIGVNNTRSDVSMNSDYTGVSHNNFWGRPMWSSTVYTLAQFYAKSGLDNPNAGALSSYTGSVDFVNASGGDFHLVAGSPLINKGDLANPGDIKAIGIPDIGAFEQ